MKKIALITLVCLLFGSMILKAEEMHRIITFEELPVKAQEFVNSYFSDDNIRFIRMEIEIEKTEYTVRFENGIEIEFNSNGDWDEVESHVECLPKDFLHPGVLDFLKKNHPDCCLHEVARGRHKIEVELANGMEIIFNKNGEFFRYDD